MYTSWDIRYFLCTSSWWPPSLISDIPRHWTVFPLVSPCCPKINLITRAWLQMLHSVQCVHWHINVVSRQAPVPETRCLISMWWPILQFNLQHGGINTQSLGCIVLYTLSTGCLKLLTQLPRSRWVMPARTQLNCPVDGFILSGLWCMYWLSIGGVLAYIYRYRLT